LRTNRSSTPFVSPLTTFEALESKATTRPSLLRAAPKDSPFGAAADVATLTRSGSGARVAPLASSARTDAATIAQAAAPTTRRGVRREAGSAMSAVGTVRIVPPRRRPMVSLSLVSLTDR